MSVHDSIKYLCNQCDCKFTRKGNLKTHIISVHENVQYLCNQCDSKFTQKGNLKTHIMSVHSKYT